MSKSSPPSVESGALHVRTVRKNYNKRTRNIYDKMCLRGKPKMVVIGALMRKLVHWYYGILKTGTIFKDEGLNKYCQPNCTRLVLNSR